MPFSQKTWKDRVSEHPNRRKLTGTTVNDTVTVERDEGTVSEQGDAFSAKNMNDLEERIAQTTRNLEATLNGTGWSEGPPYTQTLTIENLTENDVPIISRGTPITEDSANYKALVKNFAMLDKAETGEGNITFTCYSKKPTADIPIIIRGV